MRGIRGWISDFLTESPLQEMALIIAGGSLEDLRRWPNRNIDAKIQAFSDLWCQWGNRGNKD
jgi:hypothetical protein